MKSLAARPWVPSVAENFVQSLAKEYSEMDINGLSREIDQLIVDNRILHDEECINLDPAANIMNPRAEKVLSSGLGTRPSLGYPGDKYETGLDAIEKIEVLATELTCKVFNSRFAEIRVPSGSIANLYAFMATCQPGDSIIVPSPEIGGHATHQQNGAAGLYGLKVHHARVDKTSYTVDLDDLRLLTKKINPRLITIGGSLNLFPHPLKEIRSIADEVGAFVMYDAAHMSGLIAGKAWQQPLEEGAHLMAMSTYKSLGGPPSAVVLTNEPDLAEKIDQIAFPGLTANFDVAKSAALAITLLDWLAFGSDYAAAMAGNAKRLAQELNSRDVPVFGEEKGFTRSHQLAVKAAQFDGGQKTAGLLAQANILACGIGLPLPPVDGDLNGLRLGTPEITRFGMTDADMPLLAEFTSRVLIKGEDPKAVGNEVSKMRKQFQQLHFIRQ
ncbi:MAG: aminotransferase class I/II-fold pyridoxal phosphate-dependent enzyme [Proteobacteria bacterium]|nr:aminotransferase class I/II-fold pyridoxal phosphate-dependent enzyme [Pseudomonadota bacterium]